MLVINTNDWKEFCLDILFEIKPGKYYYSDEYEIGKTPYISASATNNGISQRINLNADFKGNCIITGKVGCTAFYQQENFCATSDVNVLTPRNFEMNDKIGLFITGVINFSENYKWSYGRQCRVGDSRRIIIKLPIKRTSAGEAIFDEKKDFSSEGYIPNWEFMEKYIESLELQEKEKIKEILNLKY